MSHKHDHSEQRSDQEDEPELPMPWKQIQTAIWLIGLAILAWRGWWWPGILVLVAISGLTQAGLQIYLSNKDKVQQEASEAKELTKEQGEWLPSICPNCGAPLSVSTVHWSGPTTADCPYCKAHLSKKAEPVK